MNCEQPLSKVLVLDLSEEHAEPIKRFCDQHGLVPVKASPDRLMAVLRSNIDLGAVFCGADYAGSFESTCALAEQIRRERPELPIMLRRADATPLTAAQSEVFCASYLSSDMEPLRAVLDEYLFSLVYPNALVRGIAEISKEVLEGQMPGFELVARAPYIVRDRLIHGQLLSLIPLESEWCRGYMMLQAEEGPLLDFIAQRKANGLSASFRDVNSLLSEITNLIWGAFKNRFIGDVRDLRGSHIQVPLVVNHHHGYISFGTENPQLCFLQSLQPVDGGKPLILHQRFIFNLNWSPEQFRELTQPGDSLVDSGELEFF